ncbi:MAG: hypothetical protein HY332_05845 [Chloroflexi bacterium]|nr:hypothetical protein [Chloroflexota bacterium]
MATQAVAGRRRGTGRKAARDDAGGVLDRIPRWVKLVAAAVIVLVLATGGGIFTYRSLDRLYPQELWKYFRPHVPLGAGSLLYRDGDGQLFLAPLSDLGRAQRLRDQAIAADTHEIVRDATTLAGGKLVAYFATERADSRREADYVKVLSRDGTLLRRFAGDTAGEPLYAAVYASASGRYVAVTNRDRTRVYYYDTTSDAPPIEGQADTAPERMLWTRNGDLRTAPLAGQRAFAVSPDGKWRTQVRAGQRRSPECNGGRCEAVQELVIFPATIAGSETPPVVVYGAFADFSADGWGPIPTQPAQRFFGRLVWSPDGTQVLFSTLDGAEVFTYAVGADGKTQPRQLLAAEALDWVP